MVVNFSQVGNDLSVIAVDIAVVDDVDLAVTGQGIKLAGRDGNDRFSGLLGEPVDHEFLGPLAIVLLALSVVEEDEGGEALNFIGALDTAVFVSVDLGQLDRGSLVGKLSGDLIVDRCEFLAVSAPG